MKLLLAFRQVGNKSLEQLSLPNSRPRIAAARLHCCVSAALRGLAVGATRLRLADAGGAGAGSACAARHSTPTLRAGRCAVCSLDPNRAICSADRRFDGGSLRPSKGKLNESPLLCVGRPLRA